MADLEYLAAVTARRARMAADMAWLDQEWRQLVAQAMQDGYSAVAVAKAAGVSRPRVYQIRDGK